MPDTRRTLAGHVPNRRTRVKHATRTHKTRVFMAGRQYRGGPQVLISKPPGEGRAPARQTSAAAASTARQASPYRASFTTRGHSTAPVVGRRPNAASDVTSGGGKSTSAREGNA